MRKIKEIGNQRFEVALYSDIEYYRVVYTVNGQEYKSEKIVGLLTANYLFELKVVELEGN